MTIHTASWCTENRYVNICIYVDSLRLFSASSPTGVVAQLRARWIACCVFWDRITAVEFFVNFIFFVFVLEFVFYFATFLLIQKSIKAT